MFSFYSVCFTFDCKPYPGFTTTVTNLKLYRDLLIILCFVMMYKSKIDKVKSNLGSGSGGEKKGGIRLFQK